MHDASIRPPIIALALWLNAQRTGHVSATDATNACEYITGTLEIHGSPTVSWSYVVDLATQQKHPCIAVLPTHGDPRGIPTKLLANLRLPAGALAIGNQHILYQDLASIWNLHEQQHAVIQPDHSYSRRMFLEGLERATSTLSSADLIGDRSKVDAALDALTHTHLPPHVDQKLLTYLDQATRVRVVTQSALVDSMAPASRSNDHVRIATLQEMDALARNLLTAIASH